MAYSDFTLEDIPHRLGLRTRGEALFPDLVPAPVPGWLTAYLGGNTTLAFMSEKARSEFVVSPILRAARDLSGGRLAIFSGQRLDADAARGLVGVCDFVLALTDSVPPLQSPIVTVLEAKQGDIELGLGQSVAQMVGSRLFNEAAGDLARPVFGCVTNAEVWQFLRLDEAFVTIDVRRYVLPEVGLILAAFGEIVARCDAAVSR